MPILDLTLCGPPALALDGMAVREADLPAKSLALLAFLALERGGHSRDELATLLWGESPQDKARASLRQSLRSLRGILGDQIRVSRDTVALVPGLRCDVLQFLELAGADPAEAVRVEIPRFLEGFAPRHAQRFEEWAERIRADLMARHRKLLAACGQAAVARRDWRGAIRLGEQWLRTEPASDAAAHLLVEALYLSGDSAAAMAVYADFRSRHEALTGESPGRTLRELVARIKTDGPSLPAALNGDGGALEVKSFQAGLTGRAEEWETLVQAWTEVAGGGGGRIVVIEGEAGAGKTRLTDDFCRWITARQGQVLRTRAWESGQGARFDALVMLLREALDRPGIAGADPISLAIIARILPEIHRRFPALAPHASDPTTSVLEEAVADLLIALADDQPVLVVVDDFHWCDPDSGAVLHYLVRRLSLTPVLWCVGLTLGHADEEMPAVRVARALRAMPGARRLPLAPLSVEDVWQVIRDLGRIRSETAGRRLAGRVHEVTGGNPFYVIELLKSWLEQGWFTAHPDTGEWIVSLREDSPIEIGIVSPSVQEAVTARVGRMPEEQQWLLMTIALHEQGLPPDVLSHVHGMSRLRVTTLADNLARRLLVVEAERVYRCAHPIIARVVRESIGPSRQRELHRAIAMAMRSAAREGGTSADAGDVAWHADAGGERGLAYEQALLAAESSRGRGATAEALHWLDVAARNAEGTAQAVVDRATAALLEGAGSVSPRPPATRAGKGPVSRRDFDLAQAT